MSTEQTAAPETGPLSLDAFVDALEAPPEAPEEEEQQAEAPEAEAEAEEVEAVEADTDDDEAELEAADDEEEEPDAGPKLPPPASWAKEDHAVWEQLTPAVQAVVAKREADRDRAIAKVTSDAGRAVAEVKQLAENYTRVAEQVTDEYTRAAQSWQQRWGNVDWVRHARENPTAYIEDKAQAESEREQIEAYRQHLLQVQADAAKASEKARSVYLAEEWSKLQTLAPELADPKEGAARRTQVIEYLADQGFTQDVLRDISAVEMTLARKAMLWDNAQKAAKSQAALPRKAPANVARAVPSGAVAAVATPKRNLQAASQRLTKSGSLDAFVDLLNAEEEVRTRKVKRP